MCRKCDTIDHADRPSRYRMQFHRKKGAHRHRICASNALSFDHKDKLGGLIMLGMLGIIIRAQMNSFLLFLATELCAR